MPLPFAWNVVIVGAWNPAILSPDGINRRLYQLPPGTPVELEMAIDRPGQFRVGYNGLVVIPTSTLLEVGMRDPTPENLHRACDLAVRALRSLPETPVSAAGLNIRYQFDQVPDLVFDLVRASLDATLADANFLVTGGSTKRTLAVNPGVLNLQLSNVAEGAPAGTLEFNFHRDSNQTAELQAWLGRVDEFVAQSDNIIDVLGVADVIRREVHP